MEHQKQKMVVFYVSQSHTKDSYPTKRASMLAEALAQENVQIVFLTSKTSPPAPKSFTTIMIDSLASLEQVLQTLQPSVFIRDSGCSTVEEVKKIKSIVPTLIHLDDFGEGASLADFVLQTLLLDTSDPLPEHIVADAQLFMADEQLLSFQAHHHSKRNLNNPPHLVIHFGEEDEGNLSFRSLRHVLQLQIPLKVTILLGSQYTHDIATLRMMALGRRNTHLFVPPYHVAEIYASADIILCSAGYMPYEVAVIGIPCIVLAQNEFELSLSFPSEQNGFTHLGLGRKVKQSNLLNAIMEPLLHESLRQKAIDKQLALTLGHGKERLLEMIRYTLDHPKRETLYSNMLH